MEISSRTTISSLPLELMYLSLRANDLYSRKLTYHLVVWYHQGFNFLNIQSIVVQHRYSTTLDKKINDIEILT
jgi:hypothetical protein